jgi:hypothetical protein
MSDADNIRKLIGNYKRRLQKLQEREALYGSSIDPQVPIEIESIETKIRELQAELEKHQKAHGRSRKPRKTNEDTAPAGPDHGASAQASDHGSGVRIHSKKVTIKGDVIGGNKTVYGDSKSSMATTDDSLNQAFAPLMDALHALPPEQQGAARQKLDALKREVTKGNRADDTKVAGLIADLVGLAPNGTSALARTFAAPILASAIGPLTRLVLDGIHAR